MKVFESTCATCHTLAAAGSTGTVGPNLDQLKPSDALVVHQVTNGGGGMPAFGSTLSKTQIQSVAKYVSTVAGTKKSKPGGRRRRAVTAASARRPERAPPAPDSALGRDAAGQLGLCLDGWTTNLHEDYVVVR